MCRLAALVGLVLVTGCSAIVDPDDAPLRCTLTAGRPDPCPVGLWCVDGECRSTPGIDAGCVPSDEICDGRDNDCDGMVDEGHDTDMDEFTWCGDGTGMTNPLIDCNNTDPTVHPADPTRGIAAGIEVCDGQDNDCNGIIDDPGPDLCTGTLRCVDRTCVDARDCTVPGQGCQADERCDLSMMPPTCVPGGCTAGSCPAPQVCDADTRTCITPVKPLGEACTLDAECESRVCVESDRLGFGAGQKFCATACCSDTDCPGDTICWTAGIGSKMCVTPALAGRTKGPGGDGAMCSMGSQCASSWCLGGDGCLANCAHDANCGGRACTVFEVMRPSGRIYQTACGAPQGSGGPDSRCGGGCRSGVCIDLIFTERCSAACATTADCGGVQYCTGVNLGGTRGWVQMCYVRDPRAGGGRNGDGCGGNLDCRDETCFRAVCADACCNDSQCGGGRCRPIPVGSHFEMHCVP